MKRLIVLSLAVLAMFLQLPIISVSYGETIGTPRWSQSLNEIRSNQSVSLPSYYADSNTKYVRLDYESYNAQGKLLDSGTFDIYQVREHAFSPFYEDYKYFIPAYPEQSWSYLYLSLDNFTAPICNFYLTVCDENGNSLSSRSAAFEVRCTDLLPTPTPAITATPNRATATPSITSTSIPQKTIAPCTHSSGYIDFYQKTNYRNINDVSYHEKRDVYSRMCKTCSMVLSTEYTPWTKEKHEEDQYHYCWKCGSRDSGKTCSHDESMQSEPRYSESRYLNFQDENVHKKRDIYAVFCQGCGDTLPSISTEWVNEAHENNGSGYCWKCGSTTISAQQTHQHDYVAHYDKPVSGSGKWADNGNGTHRREEVKYQQFCSKCGVQGPDHVEYNDVLSELHNYSETSKTVNKYLKSDETGHKVVYDITKVCKAEGCGATLTSKKSATENHVFDANGLCKCGFSSICTHKYELTHTFLKFIDIDDVYHRWDEIKTFQCVICDEETTTTNEGVPQKHIYTDGKCGCNRISFDYQKCMSSMLKLKADENAMEIPAIASVVSDRIRTSGVDNAESIIKALTNAPSTYQHLYIYSMFAYDSELDADRAYYAPEFEDGILDEDKNKIHVNKDCSVDTWFHESGHALDVNAHDGFGYMSKQNLNLYHALCDDVKAQIEVYLDKAGGKNLSKEERELIINYIVGPSGDETNLIAIEGVVVYKIKFDISIPQHLSEEGKQAYKSVVEKFSCDLINEEIDKWSGDFVNGGYGYPDIIDGITNNTIHAGIGHHRSDPDIPDDYWYVDGEPTAMPSAEAWANYFEAVITNNKNALKGFRERLPKACEYMDKMAAEMLKVYKNGALETLEKLY